METLPLFKSHFSLGKSILTLEKPEDVIDGGPDSIIKLCIDNDLKELFLVDDNMSGFLQAYTNCEENKIKLIFGVRMLVCFDHEDKSKDSLDKTCRYIVLCRNKEGYKRLIKIYSFAAQKGFYYAPRIDFRSLRQFWDDKDLQLCVPFYDSFLHKNTLEGSACVPDFSFCNPVFFWEDNDLPFDNIIKSKVDSYSSENKYETLSTKSIYYTKKEDFKSYLTFRCINKRTTLDRPSLDHMCSDEFCLESWKHE